MKNTSPHRRLHCLSLLLGLCLMIFLGVLQDDWKRIAGDLTSRGTVLLQKRIERLQRRIARRNLTPTDTVAPFDHAVFPVDRIPNWGAMRTPREWDRTYGQMTEKDFVPVPPYDPETLAIPMERLTHPLLAKNIPLITAKLFYSTRYFAAYDVDAEEFSGLHAGIDLKLARGTPICAIGGGIVRTVAKEGAFGLHVEIEHVLQTGEIYVSLYGHLATASVVEGESVQPGTIIGTVGMTGATTGPHLHLQVDRSGGESLHAAYSPTQKPSPAEADRFTVNPIEFIAAHRAESVTKNNAPSVD